MNVGPTIKLQCLCLLVGLTALLTGCGSGGGSEATVATPVISPSGGSISAATNVTITDTTSGATIYYTTNGNTPTTASNLYSAPISVSTTTTETISAIAVASGQTTSSEASVTFTRVPDLGTLTAMSDTDSFTFTNAASSMMLGIRAQSQIAGTDVVQEASTSTTGDIDWHFMPMGNSEYNLENMLTHQVLGIDDALTTTGAQALQYSDNGTADHLWMFFLLSDGNYLIKNENSGYYLQDDSSNLTTSATIDQGARATTGTGCACQEWTIADSGTAAYPAPRTVSGTGIYVHDPFMMQDQNHEYWLYGTHQTLAYSADLTTFTYTTSATGSTGACTAAQGTYWLTDDDHCPIIGPDFASWSGLQTPKSDNSGENTDLWAPSLLYANSTYYLYYAVPYEPSTGAEAVIGLATSSTPYGPWTDDGYVVTSWTDATTAPPTTNPWGFVATATGYNAIDPAPFVDNSGNWWLIFGSWQNGTHLLPLDSSTGLPVSGATWYTIGYRPLAGEEGPFIFYWNNYYYYFAPINVCCNGVSSTYRTIYGRSASVTGPYYDRGGVSLAAGGGSILVSSHANIYGPGGGSVFIDTGASGTESLPTFVYHYYDGNHSGTPTLGINRIAFTSDGWPYLE